MEDLLFILFHWLNIWIRHLGSTMVTHHLATTLHYPISLSCSPHVTPDVLHSLRKLIAQCPIKGGGYYVQFMQTILPQNHIV